MGVCHNSGLRYFELSAAACLFGFLPQSGPVFWAGARIMLAVKVKATAMRDFHWESGISLMMLIISLVSDRRGFRSGTRFSQGREGMM